MPKSQEIVVISAWPTKNRWANLCLYWYAR